MGQDKDEDQDLLQFEPINQGLGFHPFSDGLPYAPSKMRRSHSSDAVRFDRGAGAVAADQPRFAKKVPKLPEINPNPIAQASPRKEVAAAQPSQEVVPKEIQFDSLYLLKRGLAYIVDAAFNMTLSAIGIALIFDQLGFALSSFLRPGPMALGVSFLFFLNWALVTAQEIAFGTSFGKKSVGLSLDGSPGQILLRAFLFLVSLGFCGVGLLWGFFDTQKRCWHDRVIGIQPDEHAQL